MHYRIAVFVLSLLYGLGGYSQNTLSGIIIDEKSGKPVSDAHIMPANGSATISDSLGQFSILVNKMPVTIRITHVSYGQSDNTIKQWPEGILVIRIQKMISHLDEVQISGARMRVLTEKDDFSLQDFAFDENNLWMIGYTNNQANKGKLFLANEFGDTMSSVPIRGAEQLYKDAFGHIHLVLRDSVHQLFCLDNDSIILIHPAEKKEFMALMEPIQVSFSNKLVYRNVIQHTEEVFIYYYDEAYKGPKFLTHVKDSLEVLRKWMDRLSGSMWLDLRKTRYWMPNTKIADIYDGSVKTPMFSLNDSLYIVNRIKDSLLSYDQNGKFAGSVAISFHKDIKLGNTDYKEFQFLVDNKMGIVYTLERKTAGWTINPLDIKKGISNSALSLPNFAGMTGITVFNNAVYFLYYEKKHPYFTRLYRFQL